VFTLIFSWQFPHFNTLAQFVQRTYAQGQYFTLTVLNTWQNWLVTLWHIMLLTGVLDLLSEPMTWLFTLMSLVPSTIWLHATWRFHSLRIGDALRSLSW
ncbi:hypothetical protein BC827DRAFT_1079441, partial [Russula dissimulans]